MPIVHLDQALIADCKACAMQRDGNRRNSIDYSSDKTDDKGIWSFMGVVGEVALLRYFNLDIDWHFLSTDAGFCGVDVGDIWEVRATSKFSNRLFLWSDETTKQKKLSCAWSKIVVDIKSGDCHLCGWAMGYEIAVNGTHRQYDCKRSSYFLDNSQLHRHVDPLTDQFEAEKLSRLYLTCSHEAHL